MNDDNDSASCAGPGHRNFQTKQYGNVQEMSILNLLYKTWSKSIYCKYHISMIFSSE